MRSTYGEGDEAGRRDRIKLYVVIGVLAVTVIWILYYASGMFKGYGKVHPLDTAGWRIAKDLNKKLAADDRFADVALVVENEKPLKMKAVGLVHTQEELAALQEFLKTESPGSEIEVGEVVLPPPR